MVAVYAIHFYYCLPWADIFVLIFWLLLVNGVLLLTGCLSGPRHGLLGVLNNSPEKKNIGQFRALSIIVPPKCQVLGSSNCPLSKNGLATPSEKKIPQYDQTKYCYKGFWGCWIQIWPPFYSIASVCFSLFFILNLQLFCQLSITRVRLGSQIFQNIHPYITTHLLHFVLRYFETAVLCMIYLTIFWPTSSLCTITSSCISYIWWWLSQRGRLTVVSTWCWGWWWHTRWPWKVSL